MEDKVFTQLHLGCGKRYLPGYCHVDIQTFPHVDKVCDVRQIHEAFQKESVDEIYTCHVLEHCRRYEIIQVLLRWNFVMKVSDREGRFKLSPIAMKGVI